MNKKEIRSAINKAAYAFAESMGYEIHDDEGDGTVLFAPVDYTSADDTITWHRSSHDTCVLNWSSDKTKADADAIDAHMKPIIEQYNNQYTSKRVMSQFDSYIHVMITIEQYIDVYGKFELKYNNKQYKTIKI